MKSIHFCTSNLIEKIKGPELKIETYRTYFIPRYYPGEIVTIKIRDKQKIDRAVGHGVVVSVSPIQYRDINQEGKQEIKESCKDKFKQEHWFFKIIINRNNIFDTN